MGYVKSKLLTAGLLVLVALTGCRQAGEPENGSEIVLEAPEYDNDAVQQETGSQQQETGSQQQEASNYEELCGYPLKNEVFIEEPAKESFVHMVMLDDKLYKDTGETSCMARCGVMDFSFDSSTEQGEPKENYQTNFGVGYDGQLGTRENRIEILIDDVWHVFAYNENNLPGVTMKVTENTNHSAMITIRSESLLDIQYGEDYCLESYDEEINTWIRVPAIAEYAYHEIAYSAKKTGDSVLETTWETDWERIYGNLEPGQYRISKTFLEYRAPGDYTEYTLMAEFGVE